MRAALSVLELRARARARVPHTVFEYADGGSFEEVMLCGNAEAFKRLVLRQRILIAMGERSTATRAIGQDFSMPLDQRPIRCRRELAGSALDPRRTSTRSPTAAAMAGKVGARRPARHLCSGIARTRCHSVRR
jgi:isopentenyl diphosphate isomerase/L-lactate dehydrogenase-like FMN-dependent dehydrogenase